MCYIFWYLMIDFDEVKCFICGNLWVIFVLLVSGGLVVLYYLVLFVEDVDDIVIVSYFG